MNLRSLLILILSLGIGYSTIAQTVDVTFEVDVSTYLMDSALHVNGIRIAGTFMDNNAVNGTNSMPNWNPDHTTSAMTHPGNDIWEITVTFPDSAAGNVLEYKYVNGTWGGSGGDNEGRVSTEIADSGCGIQVGADYNRTYVIPLTDDTVRFCWDKCSETCFPAAIGTINSITGTSVHPNPMTKSTNIEFSLVEPANSLNVIVYDAIGNEVRTLNNDHMNAGQHLIQWDGNYYNGSPVTSGVYFVVIKSDRSVSTERILVSGK